MRYVVSALVALGFLVLASTANARLCFGTGERLTFVRSLDIKSPENEPLYLARLLRTECLLLPYAIEDLGYVLAVSGSDRYYKLTDEEITRFQAGGGLPKPLPDYQMSLVDRLFGHALWIFLPVVLLWTFMPWKRILPWGRRKISAGGKT